MKVKFILLTFLLLFARGCDFYSTSLWFFQKDGIKDERNLEFAVENIPRKSKEGIWALEMVGEGGSF